MWPGVRSATLASVSALLVSSLLATGMAAPSSANQARNDVVTEPTAEPTIPTVELGAYTPKLLHVAPGATDTSLTVVYQPIDPLTVATAPGTAINYELSFDRTTWWPCAAPTEAEIVAGSAQCNLSDLRPLRTYAVYLRAVETQQVSLGSVERTTISLVAGPLIGTTEVPATADPDKPAKLPAPRVNVTASFNPASNSLGATERSLGVGTLPKVTFSREIPNKETVEKHLVVSAETDGVVRPVAGAWGWVSERSAVFRPRNYWPGNSIIRVVSDLDRVVLGKSGKNYLVGSKKLNTTFQFTTARKFVAKVDGKTKKMKVYIDGKKVKTFPVSLGMNEWETRNGTKVISSAKEPIKIYRSESLGLTDPEDQYELEAPWNTRLTPTGEFIHAAPWAYGRLGRYNGSHGCTNMYADDAEWIFKNSIPGDVVYYTNTGGDTVEPWNGPGGLWNIPWSTWLKKSALASNSNSVETDTDAGTGSLETAKPASA